MKLVAIIALVIVAGCTTVPPKIGGTVGKNPDLIEIEQKIIFQNYLYLYFKSWGYAY